MRTLALFRMIERHLVLELAALAGLASGATAQSPWTDLGQSLPGATGAPQLTAHGTLAGGTQCVLEVANAKPNSFAFLVGGFSAISLPFAGGVVVPALDFVSPPIATGTPGRARFKIDWPAGIAGGASTYFQWWVLDGAAAQGLAASNALTSQTEPPIALGAFAAHWIDGLSCGTEPQIQIQQYDADTYILRQSLCTKYEAPFMYLLFGQDKVLMQDTGDGGIPIGATVYGIIQSWLAAHGQASIQLVVSHSHGHGDHIAGDSQFTGQPNTVVVGTSQTSVKNFFGLTSWPEGSTAYDLGGGRIVDIVPIPGHQSAHVALYDRRTAILFLGDTLYPGRLYISDFPAYRASLQRIIQFTDVEPVAWILGTHIEMSTTPGVDFPIGSKQHPNEHVLQLARTHLLELKDAVDGMVSAHHIEVHPDFIVYPLN